MKQKGFSLIELFVVLLVTTSIGLLAFRIESKARTRLHINQAQLDLLQLAGKLEQHYFKVGLLQRAEEANNQIKLYTPSNAFEEDRGYEFELSTVKLNYYEIIAIPQVSYLPLMALDSTGVKKMDRDGDGQFNQDESCWQC